MESKKEIKENDLDKIVAVCDRIGNAIHLVNEAIEHLISVRSELLRKAASDKDTED